MYPDQPDWDTVSDEVLVELVEDFANEPSCATIASGLLGLRAHPRALELVEWLLAHPDADRWLEDGARSTRDLLLGRG